MTGIFNNNDDVKILVDVYDQWWHSIFKKGDTGVVRKYYKNQKLYLVTGEDNKFTCLCDNEIALA